MLIVVMIDKFSDTNDREIYILCNPQMLRK